MWYKIITMIVNFAALIISVIFFALGIIWSSPIQIIGYAGISLILGYFAYRDIKSFFDTNGYQ
jgi:membrane protease YdiL (CAAX protease family)